LPFCSPSFTPQLALPSLAFVHRQRLQLILDPRPHLHQPMPVPEQLPEIPIFGTRYPDARKGIFQQQLQQKLSIVAVGLLLADSSPLNLRRKTLPFASMPGLSASGYAGFDLHLDRRNKDAVYQSYLLGSSKEGFVSEESKSVSAEMARLPFSTQFDQSRFSRDGLSVPFTK
jgi:hypothetical protein